MTVYKDGKFHQINFPEIKWQPLEIKFGKSPDKIFGPQFFTCENKTFVFGGGGYMNGAVTAKWY